MKEDKTKRLLLTLVIVIFLLIACVLFLFNKNQAGYFTALKIEGITDNLGIEKIYKSDDAYLFTTTNHKVYLGTLNIKLNKFIADKEITSKIGDFDYSIQLNNENVLFYGFHDTENTQNKGCIKKPCFFIIYNIKKEQIIAKIKSTRLMQSCFRPSVVPGNNNSDFIYSFYDDTDKKDLLIRYDSENKTQTVSVKPENLYIYSSSQANFCYSCKNMLFSEIKFSKAKSQVKFYQYNLKNNILKLLEASEVYDFFKESEIKDYYQILTLDDTYFTIFAYSFEKQKNFISLFRINKNKIEKIYTVEPPEDIDFKHPFLFWTVKYGIDTSNLTLLNDNEILITGGISGRADIAFKRKQAYIFNIKTKQLKRIPNMKNERRCHSGLKIGNNKVLLYGQCINEPQVDIEIYRR